MSVSMCVYAGEKNRLGDPPQKNNQTLKVLWSFFAIILSPSCVLSYVCYLLVFGESGEEVCVCL